jgi:hypothetical protein
MEIIVPVPDNFDELLSQAKSQIEKNGGTFNPDTNEFSIRCVKGHFVIKDEEVIISVTEKPIFVTKGLIESQHKQMFT